MQYDTLLSDGIAACQQLGGELWTDYNEHDPGVTILEQLVYAITDIGSRVNYPVADILAARQDDMQQDTQATLFTGDEILTCDPLTIKDYRKLLCDRVDRLPNVWLLPITDHPSGIVGLYKVLVEAQDKAEGPAVIEAVRRQLLAHRNLAEDIESVECVTHRDILVEATLDVQADASPTVVLADVLFQLQIAFTPYPVVTPIDRYMQDNVPLDQLFVGPKLSVGVIDDEQLTDAKSSISVQDVRRIIFQVNGVQGIKNLKVSVADQTAEETPDAIKQAKPIASDDECIEIPSHQVLRLWPPISQQQSAYKIKTEQGGKPYQVDANRVKWRIEQLVAEIRSRTVNAKWQMANLAYRKVPQGTARDIKRYYSIQHQFPLTYGIGKYGVPRQGWSQDKSIQSRPEVLANTMTEEAARHVQRVAQARQLKAYLLFFEQLLANYASQLAHVPRLFSLDPDLRHSYFPQPLNDKQDPDAAPPDLAVLLRGPVEALRLPEKKRYVLHISWDDRHLHKLLRSVEVESLPQLRAIAQEILRHGADHNRYHRQSLPNGEFRLFLHDPEMNPIAFGAECFPAQHDEKSEARRLAEVVLELAASAQLRERRITYVARTIAVEGSAAQDVLTHYGRNLLEMMRKFDPYLDRRHKFLDHMMARFSERFEDEILAHVDPRPYGEKDDFFHELIGWKIDFLKNYVQLSGQRGRAYDYSAASDSVQPALSGLAQRLHRLLGIPLPGKANMAAGNGAFRFAGIRYADPDQGPQLGHDLEREFVFSSEDPDILANLTKFGTQRANYKVVQGPKGCNVEFHWPDETQEDGTLRHEIVYRTENETDALAAIDAMIRYLLGYTFDPRNIYGGEEMLVVEHILLRPRHGGAAGAAKPQPSPKPDSGDGAGAADIDTDVELDVDIRAGGGIAHFHLEFHFDDRTHLARILELGRDAANYRIDVDLSGMHKLALYSEHGRPVATGRRSYSSAQQAMEGLRELLKYLDGARSSKTAPAHPAAASDTGDFYSARISIFFPKWPVRFQSREFRDFAERMAGENCPAHVDACCYWLDDRHMAEFRKLHQVWSNSMAQPKPDSGTLNRASEALKTFIGKVEKMNSELS